MKARHLEPQSGANATRAAAHLASVLAVAAVGVAAAQLALTTGRTVIALAGGTLALASLLHRRHWHAGSAGEVLTLILLGGLGSVIHALTPDQTGLGEAPLRAAMFVFAFTGLAMAALRLHLDRPEGGLPGSLAAAGLVFLACGTVRTGLWLPRLFAAYLALALAAVMLDAWLRGRAPAPWRLQRRDALVAVLLVALVPGLMWVWGQNGPRLVRSGASTVLGLFGPIKRTGFHDGPISLHALDGMSESDEVVMRVDGSVGTHLRGNVYVTYDSGRWAPHEKTSVADLDPIQLAAPPPPEAPSARIQYVSESTAHYFLPLGAHPFDIEPEAALVDPWHLVHGDETQPLQAELVWPPPTRFEPAPPGEADLSVPEGARADLEVWLQRELADAPTDPIARARTMEALLATQYTYSTSFRDAWLAGRRARPDADLVVVFLEEMRTGHCEYFASALTMLLRADGIPARFVSGYRVAERNPIGGWAVVRERHAHAWVEANLPGLGWTTLDGTPLAAATQSEGLTETPQIAAIIDWIARQARVHGRTVLLIVLVCGLAVAQIVRLVQGRTEARGDEAAKARRVSLALQAMLRRLADAGFQREHGESLEGLARRLRGPGELGDDAATWPEPAFLEAAELLDRYAALRYGDVGHRPSVEAALTRWPEPAAE